MAMKHGFGGGKGMNGTKHAKGHSGTKKAFGKAGTGKPPFLFAKKGK